MLTRRHFQANGYNRMNNKPMVDEKHTYGNHKKYLLHTYGTAMWLQYLKMGT